MINKNVEKKSPLIKETAKFIAQFIVSIASAALTALGATSYIGV